MNRFLEIALKGLQAMGDQPMLHEPVFENAKIVGERSRTAAEILTMINVFHTEHAPVLWGRFVGLDLGNDLDYLPLALAILRCEAALVALGPQLAPIQPADTHYSSHLDVVVRGFDDVRLQRPLCPRTLPKTAPGRDQPILLSPTSGTSGASKGVWVTDANACYMAQKYTELYGLDGSSVALVALPMFHNYGMFANLLPALVSRSRLVILRQWNAHEALNAIAHYRVTVFSGSPYMYKELLDLGMEASALGSLKVCDVGGAPMPVRHIQAFESVSGAVITEGYGLTETCSLTHFNPSAKERRVGSIGLAVAEAECKVLSLDGRPVATDEYGLLWLRGPMVAAGYLDMPAEQARRFATDGWFNTEDVVRQDKDGFFYLAGRLSDIRSFAERSLFPRDIEEAIYTLAQVKDCAVIEGSSNGLLYHDIYVSPGTEGLEETCAQLLADRFTGIAAKIHVLPALPKTLTGKILKRSFRPEAADEAGFAKEAFR